MVNKHVKICSTSSTIKEMQIKTIKSHHIILVRMAIFKKKERKISVREVVDKLEPSCTAGGNVRWFCCYGNSSVVSQKLIRVTI